MTDLAAPTISSLESSQVKNFGIVAIVVIVVLGLLIARVVTKIVTRIIVLVVALVLVVVVYNQRTRVADAANDAAKRCDITFFGVHVTPSDPAVKQACQRLGTQQTGK